MKMLRLLALLMLSSVAFSQRTRTTTTSTERQDSEDSVYATAVKALIDAGTCSRAQTNDNCVANDLEATGYYETFEYNGQRVIIVSGAPNHAAETDAYLGGTLSNRFTRCERWQYSVVPLDPQKSETADWDSGYENYPYYGMGVYGYAISGGTFFDTRSTSDGETALDNEIDGLDTCLGHSAPNIFQYHYHGTPRCIPNDTWLANDPEKCQFVGYMLDGFPVYGRCNAPNGVEMESCWTSTVDNPTHLANYTYGSTASGKRCFLDQANGYTFNRRQALTSDGYVGYAYVTTTTFSGVPIGLMGDTFGAICGFTP